MVAGAELAGPANDGVEFLEARDELHDLIFTETGELGAETATHDIAGGFGNLHSEGCWRGYVLALIVWIGPGDK